MEWLDFIIACRNGKKVDTYDMIEGGNANLNYYLFASQKNSYRIGIVFMLI